MWETRPVFQRSLLTDDDVAQLSEAALTVLDRVGARYQNQEILKALDARGCRVDYARETATFPRELVGEFLD